MNPNQNNPYEFILNNKVKKHRLSFLDGTHKQNVLKIIIGIGILLILIFLIYGLLFNKTSQNENDLLQVAASQQDIITLTGLGITNLQDQQLINQSENIGLVLTSQSVTYDNYLKKLGINDIAKKIVPLQNNQYKSSLSDATSNGQYDSTYQSILTDKIDSYETALKTSYAATNITALKKMLSDQYNQIETLSSTS